MIQDAFAMGPSPGGAGGDGGGFGDFGGGPMTGPHLQTPKRQNNIKQHNNMIEYLTASRNFKFNYYSSGIFIPPCSLIRQI